MSDRIFLALLLLLLAAPVFAQSLSDPTRRPDAPGTVAAVAGDGGWVLQSTRIAGGERLAVVNGQLVREGQRIGNARVLRIEHGKIHLSEDGHRQTVSMFAAIGKTPAPNPGSRE